MGSNLRHLLQLITKEACQQRGRPFNIILEGNIGSGKTTFLTHFNNMKMVHIDKEPLDMWINCGGYNLLALQYEDPIKWASTLQSYIMLTMMQIHLKQPSTPVRIMERSIFSGRYCMIENMIRQKLLPGPSAAVLDKWFNYILHNFPIDVDLIVYFRTTPDIVFKRILERGRVEESKVTYDYIEQIHNIHEEWIANKANLPGPVLIIDGNNEKVHFNNEVNDFYAAIVSIHSFK